MHNSTWSAQFILRKRKSLVSLQSQLQAIHKQITAQNEIEQTNDDLVKFGVHEPRSSLRWKPILRNLEPRARYHGVFKSRADNKFGEFILPPRTSNINIIQAIERLFTRVSRCRRAHLCSYDGNSSNSNYADHIV
jgi:hypothetical protein